MSETQNTNQPPTDKGLPENWEEMSEAERQEWADQRGDELAKQADAAATDLSDDQMAALDALGEPLEQDLAVVDLNGQQVQVKTYLDATRENALNEIDDNRRDFDAIRGTVAETMAWLIEDEQYGGESGEKVWRMFAEQYGVSALAELFFTCVEPALDRMEGSEAAQKFRQD